MTAHGRVVCAGVVLALLPAAVAAQAAGSPPEAPLEVTRAAFAALAEQRWADAAARIDSAAQVRLRHQILQSAWSAADFRLTAPRIDPAAPPCVVDWMKAHQPTALGAPGYEFRREQLLGATSADELERLPLATLIARYLEWNDEGSRLRRTSTPIPQPPRTVRTVIGEVLASDSVAYVVYSQATYTGLTSAGPDRIALLQLVRRSATWKVASPEALTGYGGVLIASQALVSEGFGILRGTSVRH